MNMKPVLVHTLFDDETLLPAFLSSHTPVQQQWNSDTIQCGFGWAYKNGDQESFHFVWDKMGMYWEQCTVYKWGNYSKETGMVYVQGFCTVDRRGGYLVDQWSWTCIHCTLQYILDCNHLLAATLHWGGMMLMLTLATWLKFQSIWTVIGLGNCTGIIYTHYDHLLYYTSCELLARDRLGLAFGLEFRGTWLLKNNNNQWWHRVP